MKTRTSFALSNFKTGTLHEAFSHVPVFYRGNYEYIRQDGKYSYYEMNIRVVYMHSSGYRNTYP